MPLQIDVTQLNKSLAGITERLDKIEKQFKDVGIASKGATDRMSEGFRKVTQSEKELVEQSSFIAKELRKIKKEYGLLKNKGSDAAKTLLKREKELNFELRQTNKEIIRISANSKGAAAGITKVGRSASIATRLMTSLRTTMITTFGVFGAIRFIGSAVKNIKEFEAGMADVRAITGATGDDLKRLSNLALNVGGIFSPTEVAKLEVKLAKLGFTIQEIINMTEGIVSLSIATGEDLGAAAELTASTIRGLGLAATDTQMVVDQLGKSFVSSGLDMAKYRESIKFIAPIAREMNIELSSIVGVLGKLADRQIFGSLAGTAFRRILIRMADSSSNLSKRLGFTVDSSEDLVRAFVKLKEEGTTFAETLKLVDVRSLTAMSALIANADVLRDYIEEVKNANGVIGEMADIKLNTLDGQLKRSKASWAAFLSTLQGSGGIFKLVAEAWADMLDSMSDSLSDGRTKMMKDVTGFLNVIKREMSETSKDIRGINIIGSNIKEQEDNLAKLKLKSDELIGSIVELSKPSLFDSFGLFNAKDMSAIIKELSNLNLEIEGTESKIQGLIDISTSIKLDKAIIREVKNFNDAVKSFTDQGLSQLDALVKAAQEVIEPITKDLVLSTSKEFLQAQIDALNAHFDKMLKAAGAARIKAEAEEKERVALEKKRLAQKLKDDKLAIEANITDETERKEALLNLNAQHKIALENLERRSAEVILNINTKLQNDLEKLIKEVGDKRLKEALKGIDDAEKIAKAGFEVEKQLMEANGRTTEQIKKAEIEFEILLLKARIASTSALTGETDALKLLRLELEKLQVEGGNIGIGGDEEEEDPINKWKRFVSDFKKIGSEVGRIITSIADAQVRATERIVDALDTKVNELQNALQIEIALNEQGFASNVALRKKELADAKKQREIAFIEREKAIKRQQKIESALQAINLITAVSSLFKHEIGRFGIFGIAAAAAAAGLMFSLFEALKGDALDATKFEKGGWRELGGKRHSGGGVNLGDMGEAEKGEVVSIFNRGAVKKHKGLITNFTDMVNKGQINFNMNHDIIGKVGREAVIVNSTVSLDDSKQIDKMNSLLEKNFKQKTVKLFGKDKIITIGNKTRIIRG